LVIKEERFIVIVLAPAEKFSNPTWATHDHWLLLADGGQPIISTRSTTVGPEDRQRRIDPHRPALAEHKTGHAGRHPDPREANSEKSAACRGTKVISTW
jgi:hypothetical protein